jgi:hypothetical protein
MQLASAAEAERESVSVPLPPAERARVQACLAQARLMLGEREAEAARTEGRTLSNQQAIDLALAVGAL